MMIVRLAPNDQREMPEMKDQREMPETIAQHQLLVQNALFVLIAIQRQNDLKNQIVQQR
jgi:hypothetical protein